MKRLMSERAKAIEQLYSELAPQVRDGLIDVRDAIALLRAYAAKLPLC
jgi:hypothetical protein